MTSEMNKPSKEEAISNFVKENIGAARDISGTGGKVDRRGLFKVIRDENLSIYPLLALLTLSVTGSLTGSALGLVGPDIARTFGLQPQFFSILSLVGQVISFVVPILVARFVQNRPRRALVLISSQVAGVLLLGAQGLMFSVSAYILISILSDMRDNAEGTVSDPLMIDLYPPAIRVRTVSILTIGTVASGTVASGFAYILTGPLALNWRGVYIVSALLALVGFLVVSRLKDPGYGTYDTAKVREAVRGKIDEENPQESQPAKASADSRISAETTRLSLLEAFRRIWAIPTMRISCVSMLVASLGTPVSIYLGFYLENRFSLGINDRALLSLIGSIAALVCYIIFAPIGDRIFQKNPKFLFYLSGALGMIGLLTSTAQMFVYTLPALIALMVIGTALGSLGGPAVTVGTMSVVPAALRPHVGAVSALCTLVGTAVGTALLGGLTTTIGIPGAVAITMGLSAISGLLAMFVGKHISNDLNAVASEVIEDEYVDYLARTDQTPLLSIRSLDFCYGQTQVLFDVDLTIAPGECVALLGVNGAGKSTLLRAISGLGLPTAGSIRLDGHDITFLEADRRARLGIVMTPGGHADFDELSVIDNLRCCGFGLPPRERRELDSRIDKVFETFPRLAQRRHVMAGTLSGGERQMLGLARAFIIQPAILLIDELSLGLAPKVVGELLEIVGEINKAGTAVVIVEQSVNVALSISDRAIFMERGRVRYDGPSTGLADTGLLRAVFLGSERETQ